jgi:hypothetical protein
MLEVLFCVVNGFMMLMGAYLTCNQVVSVQVRVDPLKRLVSNKWVCSANGNTSVLHTEIKGSIPFRSTKEFSCNSRGVGKRLATPFGAEASSEFDSHLPDHNLNK